MTATFVALSPELRRRIFTTDAWRRLEGLTEIVGVDRQSPLAPSTAPDVIITGWDTVPLSEHTPLPRLITHSGGSIRAIVPRSFIEGGVVVTQVAAVLAEAVAEFTVMAIISGLRSYPHFVNLMAAGTSWDWMAAEPPGRLLRGSTVGIVGASRTGLATIERLRAFGCDICISDPFLDDERAGEIGARRVDLAELFRASEVVSLHAPLLESTRGMISAALLDSLPRGALLVNTARAGLIDDMALRAAVADGGIRAVLDVLPVEPSPADDPWRGQVGADVTPHIAALTQETLFAQGDAVVDAIESFVSGDLPAGISVLDYDRIA